ncbi:DinB family protein [Arcticibacter tournemirensis]
MNVTDDQLDEQVKFFAGPMTRRQILILMHDHKTHHLGQLIVYLRLKWNKTSKLCWLVNNCTKVLISI